MVKLAILVLGLALATALLVAAYRINIAIVNARFAWFTAVSVIVAGHIIAVYLAHSIALRTLMEHKPALRSQYPMLGLMVGHTRASLWILAITDDCSVRCQGTFSLAKSHK